MPSIVGGLLLVAALPLQGAECVARSASVTGILVELYTSEGCDSCPPADRWLSAVGAGGTVVPVAFHVDYWDSLGWKDAFADARHTERQRHMARIAGARAIYTPQVIVAGRDPGGWRNAAAAIARAASRPARASIEIERRDGIARVSARVGPRERTQDLVLHLALTQSNLVTHVRAGENRGATLRHDYVVRDFRSSTAWKDGAASIEVPLAPLPFDGIAAFVQDTRTGDVLQALRGC